MEKLYTIQELHEADFFPFKQCTIRKLVKRGVLKAINVAVTGTLPRWRITQTEVNKFLSKKGVKALAN